MPLGWAVPAHEGGDDDTPGRAAAVSIKVLLALAVAAAKPERVEQEEEQVQSQAGESDATQQQQGLRGTETGVTPGHGRGGQPGPGCLKALQGIP